MLHGIKDLTGQMGNGKSHKGYGSSKRGNPTSQNTSGNNDGQSGLFKGYPQTLGIVFAQ